MRRISSTVACVSVTLMPAVGSSRHRTFGSVAERDADLEIALLAVREIGGQLVLLVEQAHRGEHRARPVEHVGVGVVVAQQAPRVTARLRGDADVLEHGGAAAGCW